MDEAIRYRVWKERIGALRVLEGESFRALFRSRYPNKMNPAVRAFLEAYAAAIRETIPQDRFPNLKEIQAKMAQGEAYNVKHRLTRRARFFTEVNLRPRGVYLIPAATEFSDASGTYSNLRFDFEGGGVVLPALKGPPPARPRGVSVELEEDWGEMRESSWREVMGLERPLLYVALLASILSNVVLVVLLATVFRSP